MPLRVPAPQSSSLRVPSELGAVSAARREVVAIVRDWDVPLAQETVETLELLAGEVIANAVVHTAKGCRVTVCWDGTRVRLEAEDEEAGPLPGGRSADGEDESGRGLRLVDSLALAWGCHPTVGGKAVWFEVGGRLSSEPRPHGAPRRPVIDHLTPG
ncbi:ATP-binding protein [Streptomyces sp. NPDC005805]|uniref:ATP-binding protein n=1 Tax=Streptomyces sp. NPDC005805 TaxID=3157068 RepID=UPI0033CDB75F